MRPNLLPRLHKAIPVITFTAIAMQTSVALATEPDDVFQMIKPETRNQLWINPGMVSYHFQQDKNLMATIGALVWSIDSIPLRH